MALRTSKAKVKSKKNQNPVVSPKEESKSQAVFDAIKAKYPDKSMIFTRKIQFLWDSFFRVNYHDKGNANIIKKSYFISVDKDNVVTEYA